MNNLVSGFWNSRKWVLFCWLVFTFVAIRPIYAGTEPIVLTVYSYDSLLSRSGLGPALFAAFEKRTQGRIQIRGISVGDSAQLFSRIKLDAARGKSPADLLLGIDQNSWERVRDFVDRGDPGKPWEPQEITRLKGQTRLEPGFVPFDFGVYAWMVDTQKVPGGWSAVPKQLKGFLSPQWSRKLILEDPRTSAPGMGFLSWTAQIFGSEVEGFWQQFRPQLLTLPAGWDEAYGLFLKGEAPVVWSYTTSEAYHRENGDPGRYRALVMEEGNPIQIEGAALLKTTAAHPERRAAAREFLSFLISEEAQALIPLKNWMLPARENVRLPASFKNLPEPRKVWVSRGSAEDAEKMLSRWSKAIRK
jgi:thiamine transport system substrate-binding protein